jgi:hypothetical protein
MLMSLVILAMLMTAMAVAFDASIINFQANERISKTMNSARAALLRMTTELRTAQIVGVIGVEDPDNTQCFLKTAAGDDIRYWYDTVTDPAHPVLRLNTDGTLDGNDPVLCRNVTAATFNRAIVPASNPVAIRNVRIVLTLTDDKGANPQTFAAAAVIRRNLN